MPSQPFGTANVDKPQECFFFFFFFVPEGTKGKYNTAGDGHAAVTLQTFLNRRDFNLQ